MPGGDGTGPLGLGSFTGWGRGYCVSRVGNGFAGRGLGRGFGRGRGRGFLASINPFATNRYTPYEVTPEYELNALKNEAEYVNSELMSINQRIRDLEEIAGKKN